MCAQVQNHLSVYKFGERVINRRFEMAAEKKGIWLAKAKMFETEQGSAKLGKSHN